MSAALLVATTNPHKLAEIRAVLAPLGVDAVGLSDVRTPGGESADALREPDETGATFDENAAIKARWYAQATNRLCLADDSGLEVDALGGEPGVYSARYAGIGSTRPERDAANNAKLLKRLQAARAADRTARFVCAVCVADPAGQILATSRGEFEGVIAEAPRGAQGFGYDPLLELPDGRTAAELTPEEKNARSHRGAAARAIAPSVARILGGRV